MTKLLKAKHIPTPLIPDEERPPVTIVPFKRQRFRGLYITVRLLVWIAKMIWIALTNRDQEERDRDLGRATRELMEKVGYLWIKAGQLISLRDDLLSKEFASELAKLQWQATGFPPKLAREVVERELGGPVEQFFDDFQDTPLAAASIAQVHCAWLKDGTKVVVKVQRPESDKIFLDDMAFFSKLVLWMSRLNILTWVHLEEAIWELDQMMREEVDFRYELNNLRVMRKQLRKHNIYIPKPYRRYSTKYVLVMEFLAGVLMSDYMQIRREDPRRLDAWQQENNINIKRAARRLFLSFQRQVFEDNRFHGDLHPGNIMLLRNSRLAFIDLGTISTIEHTFLQKYLYMMKAMAQYEFEKAADLLLGFVPELPVVDLQPVKEDMVRALRAWAIRTPIKSIPYYEKSLTEGVAEVAGVMAAKRIMVAWGVLRIDRSWGNMDSSMNYLYPQMDQAKLYRRYFRQRENRTLREISRPRTLRRTIADIPDTVAEYSLFLNPQLRRASRLFKGSTSKLADIAQMALDLAARVFLVSLLAVIPLYVHAFHPEYLERVPWLLSFLRQIPAFVTVTQWMSQYSETVWLLGFAVDVYLWLRLRAVAKRMEDEEIRLPSNDRA